MSPIEDLPDALVHFEQIWLDLGRTVPAVFVDYDGTLTPIAETPDRAVLSPSMSATLERVAAATPLVIVSGRDLASVTALVGIPGAWYAGSHGFDIAGPDGLRYQYPGAAAAQHPLDDAAERLVRGLEGIDGAFVERKSFAVALHYRQVNPTAVDRALAAFDAVAASSPLRRSGGKKVVELRPDVDWNKGRAVQWILEHALPSATRGAALHR